MSFCFIFCEITSPRALYKYYLVSLCLSSMNWKVTIMVLLVITQVHEQYISCLRGLGYFKSCISVTLTRLSLLRRKMRNVCLRNAWHFCCPVLRRLFSDKYLQMTGMSAKKMPERVSQHKPCSSPFSQAECMVNCSCYFVPSILGVFWMTHFPDVNLTQN